MKTAVQRSQPRIHRAGLGDVGPVTAALAEGFLHGDLAHWLVPDVETRRAVYAQYFRIFAKHFLTYGVVEVTEDFDAVGLWWPVGDEGLDLDIPGYDERLASVTGTAVGRFVALDLAMHAHHPSETPHQYLAFLAVHPDRQRQGLGTALLQHRHRLLDADGVPAFLEATGVNNRILYARHGYQMWEPVSIPGGPNLFPMWRVGVAS